MSLPIFLARSAQIFVGNRSSPSVERPLRYQSSSLSCPVLLFPPLRGTILVPAGPTPPATSSPALMFHRSCVENLSFQLRSPSQPSSGSGSLTSASPLPPPPPPPSSPSPVFSSLGLLHNRCSCNASQLEQHRETESETDGQRQRGSSGGFYDCAHARAPRVPAHIPIQAKLIAEK